MAVYIFVYLHLLLRQFSLFLNELGFSKMNKLIISLSDNLLTLHDLAADEACVIRQLEGWWLDGHIEIG